MFFVILQKVLKMINFGHFQVFGSRIYTCDMVLAKSIQGKSMYLGQDWHYCDQKVIKKWPQNWPTFGHPLLGGTPRSGWSGWSVWSVWRVWTTPPEGLDHPPGHTFWTPFLEVSGYGIISTSYPRTNLWNSKNMIFWGSKVGPSWPKKGSKNVTSMLK